MKWLEKSSPPKIAPTTGMMMSSVRLVAIFAKAAPMITATARSSTLPLAMNARNSFNIDAPLALRRIIDISALSIDWQQQLCCVGDLRQHIETQRPYIYLCATHRRGLQMTAIRRLGLLAPLAAFSLAACGLNSVPTAEEQVNAQWANLQADYQRRADLIPNLVNTVKGYAKQESSVLITVTQARADAGRVKLSPADLDDPAKVKAFND